MSCQNDKMTTWRWGEVKKSNFSRVKIEVTVPVISALAVVLQPARQMTCRRRSCRKWMPREPRTSVSYKKQPYQSVTLTVTLFSSEFLQKYKLLSLNYLVLITSFFRANSSQAQGRRDTLLLRGLGGHDSLRVGHVSVCPLGGWLGKISPSLFNNLIFWPKGFNTFSLTSSVKVILKREGRRGSTCWHVHPSRFRLLPCSCRDLASAHCHTYAKSPFAPFYAGKGGKKQFTSGGFAWSYTLANFDRWCHSHNQ